MKTCPSCHVELPPQAAFCLACGARVAATPAPGSQDPFVGATVKDTYFVEARIGGGGMGDVYLARHVTLDVPVALKILKRSLLADPSVVQRFHREARAASRLRHPNIVQVTDFGALPDGTLFMAMEHVLGQDLGRLLSAEFPLDEARIVRIGAQILGALAEAHESGILHRDLKPANVMIEARRHERDFVKVLDFGIAKLQQAEPADATLTQTGIVCGTPGYMSPEQWSADPLDPRSDLYAVGVILYELLTGCRPLDAQTPLEMVKKLLTEPLVPPSERCGHGPVSPELEALVLRALSTDRERRPASAEAMRDELLACALVAPGPGASPGASQRSGTAPSTEVLATPPPAAAPAAAARRAASRWPAAAMLALASTAAGAVIAAALLLVLRREPRPPEPAASAPPQDAPALSLRPHPATAPPAQPKAAPAPTTAEPVAPPAPPREAHAPPRREAAPKPAPAPAPPARPSPAPAPAPQPVPALARTEHPLIQFASAQVTKNGAAITDVVYSERNNSRITGRAFADGHVTISGVVNEGRTSRWGGIGFTVCFHRDCSPIDAWRYRSMTIWLASPTVANVRIRLMGPERKVADRGCYPIFLQMVSDRLTSYVIPFTAFALEPQCERDGRSIGQTLPALIGFEIVDPASRGEPTSFTVGDIRLDP